jgi:hypothetical protein
MLLQQEVMGILAVHEVYFPKLDVAPAEEQNRLQCSPPLLCSNLCQSGFLPEMSTRYRARTANGYRETRASGERVRVATEEPEQPQRIGQSESPGSAHPYRWHGG